MLPLLTISRMADGIFAVATLHLPDQDDVLSHALATFVLTAADGAGIAIYYDECRWRLDVTPELREQARALLIEEQKRILAESRAGAEAA